MDPIERAREGDAEFFRKNEVSVFINSRDSDGDSVLSEAGRVGHVECVKVILEKCPQLLHVQNSSDGFSALHWAAKKERPEIAKLLIGGAGAWLFRMVDNEGKAALQIAVEMENLEIANMLAEADPNYVFSADKNGENPLSIAVKQSFGKTDDHDISVKIRRLLLEKLLGQVKVRIGNLGWTILHSAASEGDLGAFEDIIRFYPKCMQLIDNNGQNFMHIAAKSGHVEIVRHALETKEMIAKILNKHDNEGNAPLHVALQSGNTSLALSLIYDLRVVKMTKNAQGKTALSMKRAFGLDEEVLKWSIPTEHLELYVRLVKRFGELTQPDLPEFKVGPANQALRYFLEIVTEMLDTKPASIIEEKLSKWESVSSFYSFVGLRIGWFPQRVSWYRECFLSREKEINSLAHDFEISDKAVQLKREELAKLEAELGRIRVALETARTGDAIFDFTIFDD